MRLSHQGITPLHFCDKGVKMYAHVYQEVLLHGVEEPHNTTVFKMGLPAGPSSCPQGQDYWSVAAEERSGLYQRPGLALNLWTIILYCFERRGMLKASLQPAELEEFPQESIIRDPPGNGACNHSRVAGESQGLHWCKGQTFWVTLL